jgi:hypothetical protein
MAAEHNSLAAFRKSIVATRVCKSFFLESHRARRIGEIPKPSELGYVLSG